MTSALLQRITAVHSIALIAACAVVGTVNAQNQSAQEAGRELARQALEAADANGDDKVSREEVSGPARLFPRADEDGDGFLTLPEFERGMVPPDDAVASSLGRVTPNDALVSPRGLADRRRLAGTVPPEGTNQVIVSHSRIVASIVWYPNNPANPAQIGLPEGTAFIVEALGDSNYRFLKHMALGDWQRLAEIAQARR